jgi:hypothetical protein
MKHDYLKQCKGEGVRDRRGAEHDCGRIFTSIHDIIDGALPENLCQELEELRGKCPFCVEAFLKTLQRTVDVYGNLPRQALSDDERVNLRRDILKGLDDIRRDIENH